jgi:membrane protease YdiL (CAAX protease family)
MPALRWTGLTLLGLGYAMALVYGQLTPLAAVSLALLVLSGLCVSPSRPPYVRYLGHGVFIVLAVALASHWLPGFQNAKVINDTRFTPDAVPFSMYLNLDKSLIGFWVLLATPWVLSRVSFSRSAITTVLALVVSSTVCMLAALSLGVINWAPKWPPQSVLWLANNLLLVTLVEELLFRGYIQGGLSRLFKQWSYGEPLAIALAALIFGLAHIGGGWQWMLLAALAGIGYGLAYRFGGLQAAIITHFGLNLVHFSLFSYPMLAP